MNSVADPLAPGVVFDHLVQLTDERGLFEHARWARPRPASGYCLDDVSRALVVACREPASSAATRRLTPLYLDFVLAAVVPDGRCHNRMGIDGHWHDDATLGDWWGRALWGLGTTAAAGPTVTLRTRALAGFRIAAQARSPHRHAMAFAALGAAALLAHRPTETAARELLADTPAAVGPLGPDPEWPWPEPRLRYANAALAEALILAGGELGDSAALGQGLQMLAFLLRLQLRDGHLSVTPAGGHGIGDRLPGFDQQPIEVAALADACASAYRLTGEPRWRSGIQLAWRWFLGENDSMVCMYDPATGGGYDGLEDGSRNLNQGAESTLAMLSTAQHAQRIGRVA